MPDPAPAHLTVSVDGVDHEVPAVVLASVRAWLTRTAAGEDVDPGSMLDELVVAG